MKRDKLGDEVYKVFIRSWKATKSPFLNGPVGVSTLESKRKVGVSLDRAVEKG